MRDAIERNRRRSAILIAVMVALFAIFGYLLGGALYLHAAAPRDMVSGVRQYGEVLDHAVNNAPGPIATPSFFDWTKNPGGIFNRGGLVGLAAGSGVGMILALYGWFLGGRTLLSTAGAVRATKQDAPQLFNVVEEMTLAAGLPKMPDVYVIDDDAPNAFAAGRTPNVASVAVTRGLLQRLNRDELQGVIAHEIGHVRNLDIRFLTLAATLLGGIVLISELFIRSLRYSGRRSSNSKNGGAVVYLVLAIILAILAPIFAQLLFFACSRRREYLADATAAWLTRYPEGLASALEKIGASGRLHGKADNKALAALYIVNPLQAHGKSGLFSTHPPLDQRILILRGMSGGAGYVDYENAFRRLSNGKACVDESFLKTQQSVKARPASADQSVGLVSASAGNVALVREATALVDRAAGVIPIACDCGLRLKLPANFTADHVKCPRCGRIHETPHAEPVGQGLSLPSSSRSSPPAPTTPLVFRRRGTGWEAFRCRCGHTLQLSPQHAAPRVQCRKCGQTVVISAE